MTGQTHGFIVDLGSLVEYLAAQRVEVGVVDPLYLALLSGTRDDGPDARSLYQMGATFRAVAMTFKAAGITPVLAHHANRTVTNGQPMELGHLAYAGIAEFARQWVLLSRREPYQGDGNHLLWVNVGGSAGQSGLWAADIREGVLDDDFGGRVWEVEIQTTGEMHADRTAEQETRKQESARRKREQEQAAVLDAIDAEVQSGHQGATKKRLRDRTGYSDEKVKVTVNDLLEDGRVESVSFWKQVGNGATVPVTGYRRCRRGDTGNTGNPSVPFPLFNTGEQQGEESPL